MLKKHLFITILALITIFKYASAVTCNSSFPYSYSGACFQQCPWNNTVVTYLQNSGTACLLNCTSGTFADDSTKTCVTTCPSSPILTYYDLQYNKCVMNCSDNSLQFAAPNNTCVTNCPSPTFGNQILGTCLNDCPLNTYYMVYNLIRLCVSICYPNFYANSSKYCVAATSCPSTPVAFFGDDSTGLCVKVCPVAQGTFADNSTRKCVIYCPLGSFADSTNRICVATCPTIPSYFGSNITRNCLLQCNEGEFADSTTRQCTLVCPTNYYGDYSTRKCVTLCPQSQNTFADPLTNLCVPVCSANYFADVASRFCVQAMHCTNNTFGDPVIHQCVEAEACSEGLFVDISQGICVFRCSGWGNPLTGICENSCPFDASIGIYYKDDSTNICVLTCPVNPRTFADPNTKKCQSICTNQYFADPSTLTCVKSCPDNFYANNLTKQCVSICTRNSTNVLYFYKPTLSCLSECPVDYFADNSTLACEITCLNSTYGYPVTKQCLSNCPVGWFAQNYTVQCVTSCSIQTGLYADPSTNLCVQICPQNPDYYGQDLNDGNNTCVPACVIAGFFADPLTRTCVYSCNSTAGYYGYPTDSRCYLRCPAGYGNPLTSQCIAKCPSFPKFFYGDNLTGLCVLSCPSQTYGDPTNNLCVTALNCSAGLYGDDATGLCVPVCSQILNLYADQILKKCVEICTFPYYADPTNQNCTLTCSAQYFKDNSTQQCVKTCSSLPTLFGDPNSGYCEYNCTNNWFAYASGSQRICLAMCPSKPPMLADLQNYLCVSKCANNTFAFINNTFRGCLDYCPPQVFNSSFQINLFADNTTWKCVAFCPYGYYSFVHPNNSTIRKCVQYCEMVGTIYYYAEDTKRQCVTTCPLLYKFTYGDKIDFRCTKVCSRNQYKDNSTATCVYKCPNGTYANNITWNCSAWCNEGYFAENINNTCVKVCPKDLYGYNKVCIPQCPNNTLQYNDNKTWLCVSVCPSYPNYFADNYSVSCVLQCPNGTYADVGTRTCVLPINCTEPTIADPISGRCVLQCTKDPMYYLTIELNLCGSTCSNGTFAFNQTNICVNQCPEPYFGVNSTSHFYCTQYCPSLQYMWVNVTTRMCIPNCPDTTYRDILTMSCVQTCSDYYYSNSTHNLCVQSCAPWYADDTTKACVPICPNGTTASNHSYKCQDYCDYGQYNLHKVCQSSCPVNLFADNLTRACLSNCPFDPLTFADPLSHKCVLTCSPGQYAFLKNLTCASYCPEGFYKQLTLLLCLQFCLQGYFSDNKTQTCVTSCSLSNYSFADPTNRQCVQKCPQFPDLYGYANQCITQCPSGYFAQNFTRTCVSICPNVSSIYLNASWADDLTRRCLSKCSALSYAFTNSTKNLCLNICPTGFYASIADQACLTQCPPGSFAHNSTTTCVDQCPPGQWADLVARVCMANCSYNSSLFADDSSAACVSICPTYPDLYADSSTQKCVLSCPPNTYAYNITRTCQAVCPYPYFADLSKLQCVLTCLIPNLAFADNITRQCVGTCYNHTINGSSVQFYADNSTLRCVSQCPQFPNKLYGENISNICMQSCPSGTYGDNDTRVCLDKCVFQKPKFTWKDRLNNFCVTFCPYTYYADNYTGACELTCSNGTFADQSSRRCVINCPINPASYSTIVNGVGVCVYNCPNGTYSSQVSISCVINCPVSPLVYYKYSPTNACVKQCVYPYYADTALQACTQNCKVGFYGNKTLKSCQPCQIQCVTCIGYLVCTSCIQGFYLYQITCVVSCPSYPVLYFAHKQSGVCYTTCPAPYFGQTSTGICQLTCASLQYPNLVTRTCTACPTGCVMCNSVGCSSCSTGYTFLPSALACNKNCNATARYYFNNTCYTACPAGSYLSYDLVHCLACSNPCATCVGAAGNCTACIGSYYYLGQCLNSCPNNFYIDSYLNCISCTVNPQKCVLPPLTYVVKVFTANYQLQAYVVFNRAVNMTINQFTTTVQIFYNGQALKPSQFTATVFNSTTYLVKFSSAISLNQNSLSFSFTPGSITDQYGNVLTTVTVSQNVTVVATLSPSIVSASKPIQDFSKTIAISILLLLALLFLKSNYAALIALQVFQLMHLHIFLNWNPLPFLEYKFLDSLRYFNFMFLPSIFPPLNINNGYYSVFTNDISYLSNSPIIIIILILMLVYLLVSILSYKKLISNKHIRKLFKRIKKYRVKYALFHDIIWAVYPYAIFISLLQFKMGKFGETMATMNIALSALTFFILNAAVIFFVYLAYKYKKQPEKIPKKYNFMQLEATQNTLDIPIRYGRKLIFAIALLLPSFQSQLIALLSINCSFFVMYLCFRPSKTPLTNYVCFIFELLLIVLEGLFYAYDKLKTKNVDSQFGFSVGMMTVEGLIMITAVIWIIYRLILVIKQATIWKLIYERLTRNTDPQFLKQQQRKRDLQYDFEGLDAPSQDQRTDNGLQKMTAKRSVSNQKFNIFDQQERQQSYRDLEKPFKINQSIKRPSSMESSQKIALKSRSSQARGFFEPNKSANNFRRRNHLQIRKRQVQNSVDEIQVQNRNESMIEIVDNKETKKQKQKVLWDIDFDEQEI